MIRALQKKFVITSMTAISVLLLVLLGGINITNIVLSEKETEPYTWLDHRTGARRISG